jgi:hypothetical protein
MVNYQDTKIYYILIGTKKYYGHTAQKYLSKRENEHKTSLRNDSKRTVYEEARKLNMKPEDISCVWVEDYPCNSVEEARARERYWIENFGELNIRIPNRTAEEYRKQKIDDINKKFENNKQNFGDPDNEERDNYIYELSREKQIKNLSKSKASLTLFKRIGHAHCKIVRLYDKIETPTTDNEEYFDTVCDKLVILNRLNRLNRIRTKDLTYKDDIGIIERIEKATTLEETYKPETSKP